MGPGAPQIHVASSHDSWAADVCSYVVRGLRQGVDDRGHASLVLAGGETPLPVYRRLAGLPEGTVPWSRVDLVLGDERMVGADQGVDNRGAICRSLIHLFERSPASFTVPELVSGDETVVLREAQPYARGVQDLLLRDGMFDVTLLGVGSDGHTASLFPGDRITPLPSDGTLDSLVAVGHAPRGAPGPLRVTLTPTALARSRFVAFLAVGSSKADAVRRCLEPSVSETVPPAGALFRDDFTDRSIVWFLDEASAAQLSSSV